MHSVNSLQAAASCQASKASMPTVVYRGILRRALFCVLLVSVATIFFGLQGVDGVEEGATPPTGTNEEEANQKPERSAPEAHSTDTEDEEVHATQYLEPWATEILFIEESQEQEHLVTNEVATDDFSEERAVVAENDPGDKTCQQATCRGKIEKLWRRIKEWWRRNMHPRSRTCEEVKRAGGVPSVSEGHSPIETFGYPYFDTKSSRLFLEPRIPLSVVDGYMQPIKVGAADYVVRGSLGEILAFLDCFEDYEVIASAVDSHGHWISAPGHSNVVLQLQNVSTGVYGPLELKERLVEMSVKAFTKVTDTLRGEAETVFAKNINMVLDTVDSFQAIEQRQDLRQLLDGLLERKAFTEVVEIVWLYIKYALGWERLKMEGGWADSEAVDLTGILTLKISSYPQPSHGVRATLVMPVNRTTLKDIRKTLPEVFSRPAEHPGKQ